MKIIVALLLFVFALMVTVITVQAVLKVDVCHATGSNTNPYVLNSVAVHSVDDATGLNGHGDHPDDAWLPFTFEGVEYPGQNTGLFGTIINKDCSLVVPTATSMPPTNTPTDTPTSTPSPTFTLPPVMTDTPTNTPTNTPVTPSPTYDPPTPTATGTQLAPTATETQAPTQTPTETPTDIPTVTPTNTPFPPKADIAYGLNEYPGSKLGYFEINNTAYELYSGVNAPDGSLMLPTNKLGGAFYKNGIWVHRAWNSGWVNLELHDIVTVKSEGITIVYEVESIEFIRYGEYPKSEKLYIASCYSSDDKTWTGIGIYWLKFLYIK